MLTFRPSAFVLLFAIQICFATIDNVRGNGFPESEELCTRKTKRPCEALQSNYCFGVKLPYTMTSTELVHANLSQLMIQHELRKWEGLRSVPKCWSVIQPLLCSYYMPKCVNGSVDLPSQELCKITRNPCRVIQETLKEWPPFLQCEDFARFPSACKNSEIRELRFNTSSKCMAPMIELENSFNYYDGFEGCGLTCQNPIYTNEEHEIMSQVIKYLSGFTFLTTGVVILTFLMDWKVSRVYPSVIIFYVNVSYFIANLGWMIQFLPNTKEDIVCRKDFTIRRNEPGGSENLFCAFVFVLIYFGSMSALAWLVVFAYVWNMICNSVGRIRGRIDKQKVYFIVVSYLIPIVLSIVSVSAAKVDGSSLSGICFVGYSDLTSRITLVFVPLIVSLILLLTYFWKGTYRLLSVSLSSSDFISPKGRSEIKSDAIRVIVFAISAFSIVAATLALQITENRSIPTIEKSLRESILCRLNLTEPRNCEMTAKPDFSYACASVVMFFVGGILVSSWAWTSATLRTWKRYFQRKCGSEDADDQHQQPQQPGVAKHKLISKAFAKRHQLPAKGRLSVSLYSSHEDPVGLNKLLDPIQLCVNNGENIGEDESQLHTNTDAHEEISSEWAAGLPRLVNRRGGLIPPSSNSVSYMSEDSRRPSCDSAMSDIAVRALQSSSHDRHGKKSRREWFKMARHRRHKWGYPWRRGTIGSSSSLESNGGSQILPVINALIHKRQKGRDNFDTNIEMPNVRKAILVREAGIQTSLEAINFLDSRGKNDKPLTCDKGIQSSLVSLHDIGTQTKKSATKKKSKTKLPNTHDENCKETETVVTINNAIDDPVVKLLTPN